MSVSEDFITWTESKKLSENLITEAKIFDENLLQSFCHKTGLYFLCYNGHELGSNLWEVSETQIIYLGKLGMASLSHWSDNTGKSTVRRSLAAMLANSLNLLSIPSSNNPKDNDRYNNYKLTPDSEKKLSEWMLSNIKISFWELPENQINLYYQALINYNIPILNFQDNPNNTFGQQIKSYRKILTKMAIAYDKN